MNLQERTEGKGADKDDSTDLFVVLSPRPLVAAVFTNTTSAARVDAIDAEIEVGSCSSVVTGERESVVVESYGARLLVNMQESWDRRLRVYAGVVTSSLKLDKSRTR